jgi:lipopolysaccharide export system permease protein
MKRISRYVVGQLVLATLFVTITITCAVWLTQSLRFIELIVNRGLTIGAYFYLTVLLLPSFLAMVVPIGFFTALVFTYNRLTSDSELIILRAVGLGPLQLSRPALVVALGVVFVGYVLTLIFMPLSYREFKDMESDFRSDYTAVLLREGAFNNVADGITVYIRAREAAGELQGIIVHDNRDKTRAITVLAERGVLAQTPEGPRVIMINGNRQEVQKDTGKLSLLYFDRYSVDIGRTGIGTSTEIRWREPRERFIHELLFPDDSPMDRQNYNRLIAEGHTRITAPLYALSFALIALAALLSGDHNRRGQGKRIVAAIIIVVALQSLSVAFNGLATRNPAMLFLLYANVLLPIAVAVWWLTRKPTRRREAWTPQTA